ncbi:MAG: DUF445 domain-containing protein [Actinobacteria bacterium]|nr:DUF445 domain-containing protein [Actinomycetota bacterium]
MSSDLAGTGPRAPAGASQSEQERRAALVVMQRRATGVLAAVAALWVALVTLADPQQAWVGYAVAAAEAGMVGGLADWFAVTALFRHPLGIPIPHTAIVAARKEQFGQTLGAFVQENFLSADVIGQRLAEAQAGRRIGALLARREHAERIADHGARLVVAAAEATGDEHVSALIDAEVRDRIAAVPAAPIAARILRLLTVDDRHEELLDSLLLTLDRFLHDHRALLHHRFTQDAPWWLPDVIDDALFNRIFEGVTRVLREVEGPQGRELRARIHAEVEAFVTRLETDPEMAGRAEEVKAELLAHPQLGAWTTRVWAELKAALRRQAADDASALRAWMATAVTAGGQRLIDDPQAAAALEAVLQQLVRSGVAQLRDEIAGLVSNTIARWDSAETSERLELLLGRDLQFIRINGTVVGSMAGLAIHAVAVAVSG